MSSGRENVVDQPSLLDTFQALEERRINDGNFMLCKVLISKNGVIDDLAFARNSPLVTIEQPLNEGVDPGFQ